MLPKYLQIERRELALLGSLLFLNFLIIFSFTLIRIVRDGTFLSIIPVQNLPFVVLGLAVWTAIAAHLLGKLAAGVPAHLTLAWSTLITAAGLVVFSFWLHTGGLFSAIAFYFWVGTYGSFLISQFWILVGERINPTQARRLFGLLGAGGILGGIGAGALASAIGHIFSSSLFLLVVAGLHVIAAAISFQSGVRDEERAPKIFSRLKLAESPRTALQSPYVRLLMILFIIGGATEAVLDYQFKLAIQIKSTNEGDIAAMLGLFYIAQNVFALLIQLGLTNQLISRLGARGTSHLLPGGLLVGTGISALIPGFVSIFGVRLYDATMRISIMRTAWEFLYFPLAEPVRRSAKRFIDGVATRSAEALGGGLILALNLVAGGGLFQVSILAAVMVAGWLITEHLVTRAYAPEISQSLQRMLRPDRVQQITPESAAAELTHLLDSADDRQVLYAINQLRVLAPDALNERMADLRQHRSPAVRARVLALSDPGIHETPAVPNRPSSVISLPSRGMRNSIEADGAYTEWSFRSIVKDLDHPDRTIRETAFSHVATARSRVHIPLLISRLESSTHRRDSRNALAEYGDLVLGTLGDYLVDERVPPRINREIPHVLAIIGGQNAAYTLLRGLRRSDDTLLQLKTLWALNRIRKQDPNVTIPQEAVVSSMTCEVHLYLDLLLYWSPINELTGQGPALLTRTMHERIDQCQERIFRLLALIYPPHDILLARRGLNNENPRVRSQAREYLEAALSHDHRVLLEPVIDDRPLTSKFRLAETRHAKDSPDSVESSLSKLLSFPDPWLQACVLYVVGELKIDSFAESIQRHMESPVSYVSETAHWAFDLVAEGNGGRLA